MSDPIGNENPLPSLLGSPNIAQVAVNGVTFTALVDSDSQVTTITQAFVEENQDKFSSIRPLEEMLTIKDAGNHVLPYEGFVLIELCLYPDGPRFPFRPS